MSLTFGPPRKKASNHKISAARTRVIHTLLLRAIPRGSPQQRVDNSLLPLPPHPPKPLPNHRPIPPPPCPTPTHQPPSKGWVNMCRGYLDALSRRLISPLYRFSARVDSLRPIR